MIHWKKRTSKEIEDSLSQHDLTGGYGFLPWVWYMRKFTLIPFFLLIFMGLKGYQGYLEYNEIQTLIVSGFFGIIVPCLIVFLLYREHKDKKNGISR